MVAAAVRAGVSEPAFFGRLGGEEFLIVLPQTDLEQARATADRFRQRLMSIDTSRWLLDRHSITASIGCAVSVPGGGYAEHHAQACRSGAVRSEARWAQLRADGAIEPRTNSRWRQGRYEA